MPSTAAHVLPKSHANAYRSDSSRMRPGGRLMNRAGASANSISSSSDVVLVGDREDVVEYCNAFVELLAGDRERWADHDHVPVRHQVEAALKRRFRKPGHRRRRLAGAVEGHERLARLARAHELEA